MRSVGRDVNSCRGSDDLLDAAKGGLDLSLEHGEGFLEVMPMRGRTSAWRDLHIDEAEAPRGVFAVDQDRICISNDPDVRMLVIIGTGEYHGAVQIVGGDGDFFFHVFYTKAWDPLRRRKNV